MGGKTRNYQPEGSNTREGLAFQNFALDQPASVIGRSSAAVMDAAGLPTPGLLRLAMEGYVTEMGVSPTAIEFMETAGQPGGLHIITGDEANRLGLNTPQASRTKWTLVVVRGGLALYGSGDDRWTHYDVGLQCNVHNPGSLEYTIAIPADSRGRKNKDVIADYEQGITGAELINYGTDQQPTPLPRPTIGIVSGRLFVSTSIDAAPLSVAELGKKAVQFVTDHARSNTIPVVNLSEPQVADDLGALLKNCRTP
jgi:hypothetical protein